MRVLRGEHTPVATTVRSVEMTIIVQSAHRRQWRIQSRGLKIRRSVYPYTTNETASNIYGVIHLVRRTLIEDPPKRPHSTKISTRLKTAKDSVPIPTHRKAALVSDSKTRVVPREFVGHPAERPASVCFRQGHSQGKYYVTAYSKLSSAGKHLSLAVLTRSWAKAV